MTTYSNRGVALISVLWLTSLLAIITASFASTTHTETRLAHNHAENAKAEALADAGVHVAALALLDVNPETAWHAGNTVYAFSLGEGDVQVRIEDEDGKIDLNDAPLQLLAGLFIALGLTEDQAHSMADRIGDFRDEDSEPERLGAEDEAYLKTGLLRGAADRPFVAESELLHVLGMTQSLYEQVRPFVTVYSDKGIDPTRAPRPVLQALPGTTAPVVEALLKVGREVDPYILIDDEPLLNLGINLVPSRDLIFTIRALGRTSSGGQFLRESVIELDASRYPPFLVYAWGRGASLETVD